MDTNAGQQPEGNNLIDPIERKSSDGNGDQNGHFSKRKTSKQNSTENFDFEPPDGGWGWIVCVVSFWTNATLFGVLNTFGMLLVELVKEFGEEGDESIAFKTSWVGALQIATTFSLSPISSIFVDRIGVRQTGFLGALICSIGMFSSSFVGKLELMYLTYGILVGFGSSLLYTPSLMILGQYFKKRLGVVNGIVAFGSAASTMILPLVIASSLDAFGWRWTVRLQTLFYAVLLPGALVWKPLMPKHLTKADIVVDEAPGRCSCCAKSNLCDCSIWQTKGYLVWAIALPISFLGYFVPFVHLISHTQAVFPNSNAEVLLTCIGLTTGVSRLVSGKLADFPQVNRIRMQQVSFLVIGLATACIPFVTEFWMLITLVLIMGACDGCFICLLGPIAFDLLGTRGAAQGLGCLLMLMSVPMTAGPPIAGFLKDMTGNYTMAFVLAGMPPIIGSLILFCVPYKIQVVPNISAPEALAAQSMMSLDKITAEEYQTPEGHRRVLVSTGKEDPTATPTPVRSRLHQLRGDSHKLTSSVPNLAANDAEIGGKRSKAPQAVYWFSSVQHLGD